MTFPKHLAYVSQDISSEFGRDCPSKNRGLFFQSSCSHDAHFSSERDYGIYEDHFFKVTRSFKFRECRTTIAPVMAFNFDGLKRCDLTR